TLLHGILDIESAKFLQSELLKNNPLLTVYTASSIDKIEKSDKYITCYFSNPVKHKLQTDFIITAIGLVDNRNWGFELSTDKYLQVNNCKNIFAAGDCAAVCGKTTRFYKEARLQGRIAGKNIAGKITEYSFPISECRSVFNNIPIYTAGTTDVNSTECQTEYNSNSMKKLFYRQDKLIGCILAGDIRTSGDLYEVIQKNHLPPR
ncbi:MAG: FAD-dependent oxidoreductase, partial [Lentisphaeria bacterium]|nr:FAD-dependent oxidoreductase [Lentisphaeria bacterium]